MKLFLECLKLKNKVFLSFKEVPTNSTGDVEQLL